MSDASQSTVPTPSTKDCIKQMSALLASQSPDDAAYLLDHVQDMVNEWEGKETPEYQEEQRQRDERQERIDALTTAGVLTGRDLPLVWEDGIPLECPDLRLAMAPASTFKDSSTWRYHYGLCMDACEGTAIGGPSYILIRDDLSRDEVRRTVAEAAGAFYVENYGDQFPALPTPPAYRCAGEDAPDTPWPVVFVPEN